MGAAGAKSGNLLRATIGALVGAVLLLVTLVLPAEYGIDPLGTGAALGLLGLAEPAPGALSPGGEAEYRVDAMRFELAPFESVEYKYHLTQGAGMVYSWTSTAAVTFDFHAEPSDAPEGFAESFRRGSHMAGSGTYTAPFDGIHGWFWENRGMRAATIDLESAGFFSGSATFRDGARVDVRYDAIPLDL